MVWICLAVSEETLSDSDNTLKQSHTVNKTDTLSLSSFHECQKVRLNQHLYGMTLQHSQETTSMCPSKSSSLDSLVKTHQPQVIKSESKTERDQVCFSMLRDLCRSWSLSLSFWKTSTESYPLGGLMSSKKLPTKGMIFDGVFYQPKMSVPTIKGNDGLVLHIGKGVDVTRFPTPNTMDHLGLRSEEALKRKFQTTRKGRTGLDNLREAVHPECYPLNLFSETNCYNDAKMRGKLNPEFLEMLMGFPIKWTELNDLGTQLYPSKQR